MQPLNKLIPLWFLIVTVLMSFCLGGVLSWLAFTPPDDNNTTHRELRERSGRLTSPLLDCEAYGDQGLTVLKPFKHKIDAFFQQKIDEGVLIDGSVYFRDLNNGMWFGINEGVAYRPASMLKVPVMIAYYKLAENNPALLDKKLLYPGSYDLTRLQGVSPASTLVPGKSYSIDELIYYMIALSDNNAAQLLVDHLDPRLHDLVLKELDVNVNPADQNHLITAHAYAGFFRALYNASYLNREFSERALEILTRSKFADGIRAGLPPGQLAATKFGEWGDSFDSEIVQLHEVGIVYYPDRPYLLVVMTRGKRGVGIEGLIREISRLVYESVDQQHAP